MAKKKNNDTVNVEKLLSNENIFNADITNEIKTSTLNYAMSVIVDRALPDVRDGLKPVQRRILFATYNKKIFPNSKFTKNAEIVGETMGKLWPHGDSGIYGALCNMSHNWDFRYPLIDFHGNNGSIDGDEPAAYRYTEGRLHKNAMELIKGIDDGAVSMLPNYSETMLEPEVLPGLLPNLLLNGSYGIAVGYTTNMPSHNLNEIIDAIIYTIKKPDATVKDIMKYIKGPDFNLGGCLINNENIEKLYTEGISTLTFKAKYEMENNHENNNLQIVIHELPPSVNKPKLMEKLYSLCIEKKIIPRVVDVRDESSGADGIRIVIELHKTAIVDVVLNELFNKTDLKKNVNYIMRCIVDKTPMILSLDQFINKYIEFQKYVYINKLNNSLDKYNKKLHIQEGYAKILTNLDKTINIIRNADDDSVAKIQLIKEFNLTEEQVTVILDMKLRQITKLGNKNINDIIKDLNEKIKYIKDHLNDDIQLEDLIIQDLKDLRKRLGDKRRTEIIDEEHIIEIEETAKDKDLMIVLTNKNTIKHYEINVYDELIKKAYKEKNEIFIQNIKANISNKFILFLEDGTYICLAFNDLLGDINNIINKQKIVYILELNEDNLNKTILLVTKQGLIKKCLVNKLKNKNKIFNLIEIDNDEILNIKLIDNTDKEIITIASSDGLIHRFYIKSFKETNPGGKGLGSMSLKDNIISDFDISNIDDDKYIILYAKHENEFYIKKLKLNDFNVKGRIAKGTKAINFTEKSPGEIYKIFITDQDFVVINNKGIAKNIILNKVKTSNKNIKGELINYDILDIKNI